MNKWYPYRFRTEEEFIQKFGFKWYEHVSWNDRSKMDYLFGKPYPFNVKFGEILPFISNENIQNITDFQYWAISWGMLIENEPIVPTYKPKEKVIRTI